MKSKLIELAKESSRGFPDKLYDRVFKSHFVFVHSYPNLDRVLQGMDVINRAHVVKCSLEVLVIEAKGLKVGQHIFLGAPKLKGVGKGYVEAIDKGLAYVSGMGSELEGAK